MPSKITGTDTIGYGLTASSSANELEARLPGSREASAARPGRFIRLIRSDRLLNVFGEQIVLGPDVVHEYVTAILHVRRGEIEVVHGGRTVKRLGFALRD